MKRLFIGLAGSLYGLFLIWIYFIIGSHNNWSPVDQLPAGCYADDCKFSIRLLLFLNVFAPAFVFFILNTIAWNRWALHKWIRWVAGLTVLVFSYWIIGYIWIFFEVK
jgi:hypothetical protein